MSDIKFNTFIEPIEEELKYFSEYFNKSLRSKVALVDLVVKFILKQKGKKLRPILVLLSAKTIGEVNQNTYIAAAMVELLHTATLVHDDVVDSAETRRGLPSINAIWKNKIAVLMGDYLLARGLQLSVENDQFDCLKVITRTVKRMSEGELLQISRTRKLNNDLETYYKIISDKTASLISSCTQVGALSVSKDPKITDDFTKFGEYIGMAFQIKDDIFDFSGKKNIIGKPIGNDLKEKKLTLPLLAAFKNSSKSEINDIKKMIKKDIKDKEYEAIVRFTEQKGGIKYAYEKANEYKEEAIKILNTYPESESKKALINIAHFVVERNN